MRVQMKVYETPPIKMRVGDTIQMADGDYEQGYKDGYDKGYKQGESEGYTNGLNDGYADGYSEGFAEGTYVGEQEGYSKGYSAGHFDGKTEGFAEGYTKGMQEGNTEGYDRGYAYGYEQGYSEGYAKGFEDGRAQGYSEGYNKGKEDGKAEGYTEGETSGIEQGRNAEWSEFWEDFQQGGARTGYRDAFMNWTDRIFKPKYDIRPSGDAHNMFKRSTISGDFQKKLENFGVVLDLSKATYLNGAFQDCKFSRIGIIDVSKANKDAYALGNTFYNCPNLVTIDKFIVSENTQRFQETFHLCYNLTNITFEGVITKNGLHLTNSIYLTHDSLMSVINCLKDYSTDTSGTSHSVTLGTTNLKKLTDTEKAIATQRGWTLA